MPGEEYVAHWREAGEEQRNHKAKDHDPGDLAAELVLCNAHDCLIGGHHALRASSTRNHGAERLERIGDKAGAGTDEQEAERGLDGAADGFAGAASHRGQADRGDDTDEECRYGENLINQEICYSKKKIHEDAP